MFGGGRMQVCICMCYLASICLCVHVCVQNTGAGFSDLIL